MRLHHLTTFVITYLLVNLGIRILDQFNQFNFYSLIVGGVIVYLATKIGKGLRRYL